MIVKRFLAAALIFSSAVAHSQSDSSKYDPHALFSPLFYTQSGNEYRAATGEPGPAYWQNRVDYQISASLNEAAKEVTSTVVISYKNNSPLQLPYVWLQLDQNLFNSASRGQAK